MGAEGEAPVGARKSAQRLWLEGVCDEFRI